MMRPGRGFTGWLSAAALVVGVVACGDDDDGGADSAAARPDQPAAAAEPDGPPIKVMVLGDWTRPDGVFDAPAPAGAQARAEHVNAAGGIDGRPLEVIVCDTQSDPNRSESCARDAVDQGVVAVVGASLGQPTEQRAFPILEENSIASVGNLAIGPLSLNSPISFPTNSGLQGALSGMAQMLVGEFDAPRIGFVMSDLGQATGFFTGFVQGGAEQAGGSLAGEPILLPIDAADPAPYVATVTADDPDGLILFIVAGSTSGLIQALRQNGYDRPVFAIQGLLTSEELEQMGPAAEDVYSFSSAGAIDTGVAGYEEYVADMEAFDADIELSEYSERSVNAWIATYVLEQVLGDLTTIDAPSVLQAMSALDEVDTLGILQPFSYQQPIELPFASRLFNPYGLAVKAEDGQWAPLDGRWFDPFSGAYLDE